MVLFISNGWARKVGVLQSKIQERIHIFLSLRTTCEQLSWLFCHIRLIRSSENMSLKNLISIELNWHTISQNINQQSRNRWSNLGDNNAMLILCNHVNNNVIVNIVNIRNVQADGFPHGKLHGVSFKLKHKPQAFITSQVIICMKASQMSWFFGWFKMIKSESLVTIISSGLQILLTIHSELCTLIYTSHLEIVAIWIILLLVTLQRHTSVTESNHALSKYFSTPMYWKSLTFSNARFLCTIAINVLHSIRIALR